MADRNLSYYVPPNLRRPLQEAGRVGYNILDNIIGFDDEYDTTGELLARSLREDPVGTGKDIASGAYEGLKGAASDPVGTVEGMAGEILAAISRLREPLPEDATREEVAQRTSDIAILSSLVPTGAATGAATRAAGRVGGEVIDSAQRSQAARFARETEPLFPGSLFAPKKLGDVRFYHPSQDEEFFMRSENPMQKEFLDRRASARDKLAQGSDPYLVAHETSILPVPRRTLTGEEYDPRMVAAVNPSAMSELRPSAGTGYRSEGLKAIADPELRASEGYFSAPPGGGSVIAISPEGSDASRFATYMHELGHADQYYGGIPWSEGGSDPSHMLVARLEALDQLKDRIKAAETPEEKQRLTALRDDLKRSTSFELYQRNPGEMLARLTEGNPTTARALTLTESLNPYIRPEESLRSRLMGAFEQSLRGERSGILSVPITKAMGLFGKTPGSGLFYDNYARVPMDLSRAIYDEMDNTPE